jgi:hypothetical protein
MLNVCTDSLLTGWRTVGEANGTGPLESDRKREVVIG